MKQIPLFTKTPLFHGGTLRSGRKLLRPLSTKRPLHLVLKSKEKFLYQHKIFIEAEVRRLSKKSGLRVYGLAVNFDHIHFVLRFRRRREYRAFIRALTGLLARKFGKGLWTLSPFSRILQWGRDFFQSLRYLQKNREEASGARPYETRKNYYHRL